MNNNNKEKIRFPQKIKKILNDSYIYAKTVSGKKLHILHRFEFAKYQGMSICSIGIFSNGDNIDININEFSVCYFCFKKAFILGLYE